MKATVKRDDRKVAATLRRYCNDIKTPFKRHQGYINATFGNNSAWSPSYELFFRKLLKSGPLRRRHITCYDAMGPC